MQLLRMYRETHLGSSHRLSRDDDVVVLKADVEYYSTSGLETLGKVASMAEHRVLSRTASSRSSPYFEPMDIPSFRELRKANWSFSELEHSISAE